MEIEAQLHQLLSKKGLTLAIAESCTGGALSKRFTQIPGASSYFLGSVIAYSNISKDILLDLPLTWVRQEGAVSENVATGMAQSIQKNLNSDYALATTGIAGPTGGSEKKPVGTVWIAVATPETTHTWLLKLDGTRSEIIDSTCDAVLQKLLEVLGS